MAQGVCEICKKEKKDIRYSEFNEKHICNLCYRKHFWKPTPIICKRCGREKAMHAKGLCMGCYSSIFQSEAIRAHNAKKYHQIDKEVYKKLMKKCLVCDFDKIVEIHHLDHNHKNNSPQNLVGLCPNCHKLLHSLRYQKEIFDNLKEKGFKIPESKYSDGFFKK